MGIIYYNQNELKKDFEKGMLNFTESPTLNVEEIKEMIEEAIERMNK